MSVIRDQYVIINIWTSKKNKAGDNYPHISLTVHDGVKEAYLSLWAGQNKPYNRGFSQSTNEKLARVFSNFVGRPGYHQQDYEQDCILDAFHQNRCRIIDDNSECLEDETAYRVNSETHEIEKITPQSGELKPTEILLAVKLAPANFRMALYSLDVFEILGEMKRLSEPDSVTGWTMVGSNLLTRNRNINGQTIENSGALIFRCLMEGGLYRSRNLLVAIVNTKIHELGLYTGDADDWKIAGETPLDDEITVCNDLSKKVKELSEAEADKYFPTLECSAPEKMPKIGYTQAREMLSQVCERYIDHNQAPLGNLSAITQPALEDAPWRKAPLEFAPGFLVWVSYEYYRMWHSMLKMFPLDNLPMEEVQDCPRYEPIWQKRDEAPQIDPALLLDRLNALFGLLQYIIIKANPEDETLADYLTVHAPDYYIGSEQDPLSVQIHRTWKNLKLGIDFISTLPNCEQEEIILLKHRLEADSSTIAAYLKGRAVEELKEKLDDETLSDEEAVKAVELQLVNSSVAEIVTKNRQSQAEQVWKILSVVSILIGVGIFTTLGLAFKRLYDTGGSSLNFFKPLSKNLGEDLENLTQKTYVNS